MDPATAGFLGVLVTQFVTFIGLVLTRRDAKTAAKEVTHNGGSSLKDAAVRAAVAAEEARSAVLQTAVLLTRHTEQDAEQFAELRRLIEGKAA